jgi:hypothetical protein
MAKTAHSAKPKAATPAPYMRGNLMEVILIAERRWGARFKCQWIRARNVGS